MFSELYFSELQYLSLWKAKLQKDYLPLDQNNFHLEHFCGLCGGLDPTPPFGGVDRVTSGVASACGLYRPVDHTHLDWCCGGATLKVTVGQVTYSFWSLGIFGLRGSKFTAPPACVNLLPFTSLALLVT